MGKYDKIFSSDKTTEEALTQDEAIAAIAVVTSAASSSLEDVDADLLADILWGFDIFEEYSDDDLLEMVDKLLAIAEDDGLGALFNAANKVLSDELILDAYAAGVSVLVDEEDLRVPKGKLPLLKKLQEALEIDDEEAKEVMDDVISAFEEPEDEEYDDDEEGELEVGIDSDSEVYESPQGNFKVPLPVSTQEGGRVQVQPDSVSFSDDYGTWLRINYSPISSEQQAEMSSMGQERYLQSFLVEKYVPQEIVTHFPKAKIEHTEYLEEIMAGSFFALVHIPEGSTASQNGNNGSLSRLDAYRGLLAFTESNFLYIISNQRGYSQEEIPTDIEEEAESIKQSLAYFIDTIEFT